MKENKIVAIIVAAGYSSRMGSFKPFMQIGETAVIERIVNTYKGAGIQDIIVVTGHRGDEVEAYLKPFNVRCVRNEKYEEGMFSSVQKGVEALDKATTAFFMQPVDIPLVKKITIEVLKSEFEKTNKGIIYPEFNNEKGHPPLIDCKYKDEIINSNGEGGLRRILERFEEDSISVPFFDEAILMDMDTMEDYERLLRYYESNAPTINECCCLLSHYNVEDEIIKHCQEVNMITLELLYSLQEAGNKLNTDALKAAALLHDVSRSEKNHAKAGGELLKALGYNQVGSIIETHMDIEVDKNKEISENEILYLADKLVKEDRTVSLEERFGHSLRLYGENPKALERIKDRWSTAAIIMEKIKREQRRARHE